ncbi:MAG: 30S ribosomal protein S16 [Burkholderiaceae bacterium]|nr:30S ribosomal protein S16 [Burkholderiaceae bacterium]
MVVIRLSRGGSKGRPFFNIVVAEEGLRIAQDRLAYWQSVGAQSSPTVDRLIKQAAKKAA